MSFGQKSVFSFLASGDDEKLDFVQIHTNNPNSTKDLFTDNLDVLQHDFDHQSV